MKIGNIPVRISIVAIAVVVIFTFFLLFTILQTGDFGILVFGIPALLMLLIVPMSLNYMSQKEYMDLIPAYEVRAKTVRVRMINPTMEGQIVRIEGVVERVHFQFLNRPQFIIADRTGEISVKMFTSTPEQIRKDEVVEVLGKVMKRYIMGGDVTINAVSIRKIDKKREPVKKEE
jgi:cytochrome c-type biogenesis protein CcmE